MTQKEAEALIKASRTIEETLFAVAEAQRAVDLFQALLDAGVAKNGLYTVEIPSNVNDAPIRLRIPLSDFKALVAAAKTAAEDELAALSVEDAVNAEKE